MGTLTGTTTLVQIGPGVEEVLHNSLTLRLDPYPQVSVISMTLKYCFSQRHWPLTTSFYHVQYRKIGEFICHKSNFKNTVETMIVYCGLTWRTNWRNGSLQRLFKPSNDQIGVWQVTCSLRLPDHIDCSGIMISFIIFLYFIACEYK